MNKKLIYDLDLIELQTTIKEWGEPSFRTKQIWEAIYQQLIFDVDDILTLPIGLRTRLKEQFSFSNLRPEITANSSDKQTTKILFRLPDQNGIETVLMKYDKRKTLCISTQAGCGMGCVFCATGQMGFIRHLSRGEIVEQVLFFARKLQKEGENITNIVMMGMGEPFHNYGETLGAINILNNDQGMNIGARRFTISTVGLVPMIKRFTEEASQVNLAISLHATQDDVRSAMLPVNNRYPISELLSACRDYVSKTGRRITFEWALINGKNDSSEEAHRLGSLLKGLNCHVNVIPLNPTIGFSGERSSDENVSSFVDIVKSYGVACTVRIRRGIDINAGCGQLAIQHQS